jgi:hypothetical protein
VMTVHSRLDGSALATPIAQARLHQEASPLENKDKTGMSDTFNPSSAHKVIDGLVKVVVKEFEKLNIISDTDK